MNDSQEKEAQLVVRNLKKYFDTPKGKLHAVDNVSFSIRRGETLGVVGESGCGKSTMGRAILRLHEPTAGEVLFDGVDVTKLSRVQMKRMRTQMQIIFQDPYSSLNPRMTVSEAISEPFFIHKIYGRKQKDEVNQRVHEIMDLVGLSRRLINTYPHELDGGRRQRIGIARALAVNPKFIVCDEPVSALDVSIQAQVLNLIQDLQDQFGVTYLFITHDLSVVKHLSNDIMVMYKILISFMDTAFTLDACKVLIRNVHPAYIDYLRYSNYLHWGKYDREFLEMLDTFETKEDLIEFYKSYLKFVNKMNAWSYHYFPHEIGAFFRYQRP